MGSLWQLRRSNMGIADPGSITGLLQAWAAGDSAAKEQLIPRVYGELRQLARRSRRRVDAGDTLCTTALVHEAYLRLVGIDNVDWKDRVHFFAVSAQLMRRILVDAARARATGKRGGGANSIDYLKMEEVAAPGWKREAVLLALDEALTRFAQQDPRRARVVELRVFGGLTVDETAGATESSPQRVQRDWKLAKAWLMRELSRESGT